MLDDSNPPFYKWFAGGKLNVSYNCLDRHVEAGHGDRVAFHWRGEEGEERDITYAELHADVQRFANALKDHGVGKGDVVGIFLPMIPEVVVAMLACARIGAPHNVVFGGFSPESVRERMEFSEAKALITVDGARRKGKTAPIKRRSTRSWATSRRSRRSSSSQHDRHRLRDEARAATSGTHEVMEAADAECPAEPLDAEHPLFILYTSGSTAKPKGILHTTGGYLTGVAWTHRTSSTSSRRPTSTGARPTSAGSPGTPTSSTGRCSTAHVGDVRGRARLPGQGHLVGAGRALRRDDLLHRADRDPRLHEVGRRARRASTTCRRCGCSARSASRSTRRRGSGTARSSAASAARSSTPGGRPRPARS